MSSSSPIQTILVTGASGNCGSATLKALEKKLGTGANQHHSIRAGICGTQKTSEKLSKLSLPINYVNTEVPTKGKQGSGQLENAFKGVTTAVLIPPAENRMEVGLGYIKACKQAGVKNIVLLSVALADNDKILFGKQFGELEKAVKDTGINYCFLRCPMFFENQWGNVASIKNDSTIYYPVKADAPHVLIAVDDVGEALCCLALEPQKHQMKTYLITCGEALTSNQVAQLYSELLGKQVKYQQVSNEDAVKAMMGMGLPDWQAKGITELWNCVDKKESTMVKPTQDFKTLTGKEPMKLKTYLQTNILPALKQN